MTDGNPCGYMEHAKSGVKYRFWDLVDLSTHEKSFTLEGEYGSKVLV